LGDIEIDGRIIFNIKIYVGNIECEWVDTVHWWALGNTIRYLQGRKVANFCLQAE
jgi:hypothetical protein